MKHIGLLGFLLAVTSALGVANEAAAQTTLERVKRDGYVRVGFPNQVPYAYATEKGVLTGADAEVAKLVTAAMGIKEMDGVLTEFASLVPGLKAGRFDIVLAMFVNPQRCAQVAFSEPIYGIGQAMVVKADNPKAIRSYDDFVKRNDLRLAVMAGAVQTSYAKKLGIPDAQISSFPDGPSATAAVSAGRADAFGISALPARRLLDAAGASSGLELVKDFPDPVIDGKPARGYGAFAFRPADKDLLDAFNQSLSKILGSPEHLAAIAPFGFTKDNLPDKKTAELCQ